MAEVIFFTIPDDVCRWLEDYQAEVTELWAGFYKTNSEQTGLTWSDSVDVALCPGP